MKNQWKIGGLLLLALAMATGCNKNEKITVPDPPRIIFDSETGVYKVKTGRSVTLAPIVQNIEDAGTVTYLWTDGNGEKIGDAPSYTFSDAEEGQYYIKLKVTTKYGEDTGEVRVDVSPLAPPVISFALPGGSFDALAGVDYIIEPVVQNSEGAAFGWTLDGQAVGSGAAYTFNRAAPGKYSLALEVTNDDGRDQHDITVNVVDELPLKALFDVPYQGAHSSTIHVFAGRDVFVAPIVEGGSDLVFNWNVNEVEQAETGRVLKLRFDEEGMYDVWFIVTSGLDDGADRIAPTVTRASGASAMAAVWVACHGKEDDGFRAPSAESSAVFDKVYEYLPAPGQFINEKESGFDGENTMEGAIAYAERRMKAGQYVSLGGFGGYIIVGFDHSVRNTGDYDFAIDGNQFGDGSEPGIVWVAQDANGNGLPDDVWYELRGSQTGAEGTVQDYAVTYVKPRAAGSDTPWMDNKGKMGAIKYLGEYHSQNYYYPAWVWVSSYTLRGTRLAPNNRLVGNVWKNEAYAWGYADNSGSDCPVDDGNPEAGVRSVNFKISNAMNRDGTPAELQYIDFIKVQTGVHAQSGVAGEISTEVFSFRDLNI